MMAEGGRGRGGWKTWLSERLEPDWVLSVSSLLSGMPALLKIKPEKKKKKTVLDQLHYYDMVAIYESLRNVVQCRDNYYF